MINFRPVVKYTYMKMYKFVIKLYKYRKVNYTIVIMFR